MIRFSNWNWLLRWNLKQLLGFVAICAVYLAAVKWCLHRAQQEWYVEQTALEQLSAAGAIYKTERLIPIWIRPFATGDRAKLFDRVVEE